MMAAVATSAGSGTLRQRWSSRASAASAMMTEAGRVMTSSPMTMAAPAMAPAAAAVGPLNEPLKAGMLAVAAHEPSRNDDEKVDGQEHAERGNRRTSNAADEVAGERGHDDDGAWADEPHRDRVYELLLGQPMVVVNEPLM